jgi:hypothetical protein
LTIENRCVIIYKRKEEKMYWMKYTSYVYDMIYNEGYVCLFTENEKEAKRRSKGEVENISDWIIDKEVSMVEEDMDSIEIDWKIVHQNDVPTLAVRHDYLYYDNKIYNLEKELRNLKEYKKFFENILIERQWNGFTRGKE